MAEITKTKDQRPKSKDQIVWLLFALIIVFIYFFGLTVPLLGPDEPRYSQVAREMFERGDWVTPTLGGFDWFEKPALLYWLQIVSYKLFGVSEFAARFGSALFGLGTIASLWILGKFTAETPRRRDFEAKDKGQRTKDEFANWLALIAASSIGLLVFARGASFDIILTFPITASLVGFFMFDQSKSKSFSIFHFPLSIFYFFIGVALLAKGLIGIVFPFAIVAFYYVLSRKLPNKTFIFSLFWGTVLSLLVASFWYLPMYQVNGWKFVDEFFIQHHFQRYTSNKYQHPQPFWFFFLVLPLMTIPWLPFFLASIWDFIKVLILIKKLLTKNNSEQNKISSSVIYFSPLFLFSLSWLLVPLVFFSLSGSKLPGYILPALPAALILTALNVYKFVQKSEKRKYALQILAFLMFAVIVVLLQFVVPRFAYADSTKGLIETANAEGYSSEKIVNLYTAAHNAEFYAAGRVLRAEDGKLKRYDDFSVLAGDLKTSGNAQILALVPQKDVPNLIEISNSVDVKPLAENGELAIILVKAK